MNDLTENMIERREIYNGKVVHLVCDTVSLPNGKNTLREVCLHVGAVCVIPILADGTVLMERQYRYPHGRVFFEIPAGKLNSHDEDPLEAAKRELKEETGAVAKKYTSLGVMIPSPAILSEKLHVYLAEDITLEEQKLDDDEFLEIERVPLRTLYEMVMSGDIEDAKTQIAVLKAANIFGIN